VKPMKEVTEAEPSTEHPLGRESVVGSLLGVGARCANRSGSTCGQTLSLGPESTDWEPPHVAPAVLNLAATACRIQISRRRVSDYLKV
jgi:hypothetical protein